MCAQLEEFAECLILIPVIFPNLIYNYARSINPLILYIKLYVKVWQSLEWIQSKNVRMHINYLHYTIFANTESAA